MGYVERPHHLERGYNRFTIIGFINNIFDPIQYDNRTSGLRRADATATFQYDVNGNLVGDTTARFIPQELQV